MVHLLYSIVATNHKVFFYIFVFLYFMFIKLLIFYTDSGNNIEQAGEYSQRSWQALQDVDKGVQNSAESFQIIEQEMQKVSQGTEKVVHSADALNNIAAETGLSMEEMEIGTGEISTILHKSREFSAELDHFSAEEKAFNKYDYPKTKEHIQQHHFLLNKARSLYGELHDGRVVLSHEVLDFLQNWVLDHIMKVDKNYEKYLKDKDLSDV
jgi:hemerythrin-like metal-binding protein